MESTSTLEETRLYEAREGVRRLLEDAKRTADANRRRDMLARALRLAAWARADGERLVEQARGERADRNRQAGG